MLPVAVARSCSVDNAKCTSGFVDDVSFSHNGANGAELKTILRFAEFARQRNREEVAVDDCSCHTLRR